VSRARVIGSSTPARGNLAVARASRSTDADSRWRRVGDLRLLRQNRHAEGPGARYYEQRLAKREPCPRVQIGIHARSEREPSNAELAWTKATVHRYGSDFFSIFYGVFGVAD
jgi:hypothetical protein